ncbi:MAG: hypothetical protein ACRDR6_23725 [Pseudonocardiaceae bacterium]
MRTVCGWRLIENEMIEKPQPASATPTTAMVVVGVVRLSVYEV